MWLRLLCGEMADGYQVAVESGSGNSGDRTTETQGAGSRGHSDSSAAGGQRETETYEPYRNGVSKAWV